MMIRKVPGGTYLPEWRNIVAKGRARVRRNRPKRSMLTVQAALRDLKLRYCVEVSFWNPFHKGKQGTWNGGLSWVDFVVKGRKPFVIILDDPQKRWKEYEKEYHANKLRGLYERNIFPVVLPNNRTSQEYRILIWRHMKKYSL